jgi:hypothetical protein
MDNAIAISFKGRAIVLELFAVFSAARLSAFCGVGSQVRPFHFIHDSMRGGAGVSSNAARIEGSKTLPSGKSKHFIAGTIR